MYYSHHKISNSCNSWIKTNYFYSKNNNSKRVSSKLDLVKCYGCPFNIHDFTICMFITNSIHLASFSLSHVMCFLREFNSCLPHPQYETSMSILYKPNPQNQTDTLIRKRYQKEREQSPKMFK